MKAFEDKKIKKRFTVYVLSGIALILFYLAVTNFAVISKALSVVGNILRPFLMAFIFAYILNGTLRLFDGLFSFVDRIGKKGPHPRIKRCLSIIATWIVAVAVIAAFFAIVVPEVKDSVVGLANSLPGYIDDAKAFADYLITNYNLEEELLSFVDEIEITPTGILNLINKYGKTLVPQIASIANVTAQVGNFIIDLIVAIIVSIYLMFSKEELIAQGKKCLYAWFKEPTANRIIRVVGITDDAFSSFLDGKIVDSVIVGIICFICLSIFEFEYPILISLIVGVTNIIPFFGPFIGAIPSALLLLLINPWHALWFIVFIIALQQVDGNIIGPKILGDSTGLPALWTMFAITVGGGLFGVPGMIIGVPAFAVIYKLTKENIAENLRKKNMPTDTEEYELKGPYEKNEEI